MQSGRAGPHSLLGWAATMVCLPSARASFSIQSWTSSRSKINWLPFSRSEQDEVIAYLFHLRHADDTEYQSTLSRRLGDKDPGALAFPRTI